MSIISKGMTLNVYHVILFSLYKFPVNIVVSRLSIRFTETLMGFKLGAQKGQGTEYMEAVHRYLHSLVFLFWMRHWVILSEICLKKSTCACCKDMIIRFEVNSAALL